MEWNKNIRRMYLFAKHSSFQNLYEKSGAKRTEDNAIFSNAIDH